MKILTVLITALFSMSILTGCSSVSIDDYKENKPVMVLEKFFDGRLNAQGIVKNRSGKVIRYFNASIDASWVDGVGTLDEKFEFDDGEKQTRVWKLVKDGPGRYTASANDVVGSSTLKVAGNSIFLDYVLRIPYDGDTLDVVVEDKMYLVSEQMVINESIMKKWGFEVGKITLAIEKL
jgi:hypothetical protein